MKERELPLEVTEAVAALRAKKADNIVLLDLTEVASFTDYFLVCTTYSGPQSQAAAEEVSRRLSAIGLAPKGREGSDAAEWILLDYLNLIVHIFQERARSFYDLERLWGKARRVPVEEAVAAESEGQR